MSQSFLTVSFNKDVNRRWGEINGISKKEAYAIGIRKIGDALKWSRDNGVEILTMWGFSTDNFTREGTEISDLFQLFKHNLKEAIESDDRNKFDVKIKFIGRIHLFPREIQEMMKKAEEISAKNKKHTLNLLLAYGGREEVIDAVNKIIADGIKKVDEKIFSSYLYTNGIPDPDMIIRTSGEQRLSGLMPWQTTYSEIFFSKKLWPDFSREDFMEALDFYSKRKRRFGK